MGGLGGVERARTHSHARVQGIVEPLSPLHLQGDIDFPTVLGDTEGVSDLF